MLDVIVPVFRGYSQTRRCLESVLGCPQTLDHNVVVIDDATPEPGLAGFLDDLARSSGVTLVRNDRNLGFVASANRGMRLHPDRDVVLLNSDTEVANDWLDRLHRCAYSQPDIGTVTPFSNNATICSYPFDGWQGGMPGTLGLAALDRLVASCNAGRWIELPTAVGFCMFVRRACIDDVGLFDEQRFGRGYGEENDFSRRAARSGWRNVLAADVLVFHAGSVSFGDERNSRQRAAMKALLAVHPDYLGRLGEFSARDPVRPLRESIDLARLETHEDERRQVGRERVELLRSQSRRPTQLHFTHSWDGGTNRWVSEFCKNDGQRRNLVLRSISSRNVAAWRLELLEPAIADLPLVAWDLGRPIHATEICHPEYWSILAEIVDGFDVRALLISSLIGHSFDMFDLALPSVVVLHDLYPFCPALFGYFDAPCTTCRADTLRSCMQRNPYNAFWHNSSADDWLRLRKDYAQRLSLPWVRVAAPTHSARNRWATLFPPIAEKACQNIAHGINPQLRPVTAEGFLDRRMGGRKLRLVVPGRLLPHKGLNLFARALPEMIPHADFLLLGCGRFGGPFENARGVQIVRTYSHPELRGHIEAFDPDAALMLSIAPESFSYTMSEMHAFGLPVIATNLGAFAERIEHGKNGLLVEANSEALVDLIRGLSLDPGRLADIRRNLHSGAIRHVVEMIYDYHAILPTRRVNESDPDECDAHPGVIERWLAQGARERQRLALENQRLREEIDEQVARCAGLAKRASYVEAEKREILGSRSWRLAAPFRHLADALRTLGRLRAHSGARDLNGVTNPGAQSNDVVSRCQTPLEVVPGRRNEARQLLREKIAVPDASIIVLSLLDGGHAGEACRAVSIAKRVLQLRNDTVFVRGSLLGRRQREVGVESALLVAMRKLFDMPDSVDIGTAIAGADVLLLDYSERLEPYLPLIGAGAKLLRLGSGSESGNSEEAAAIRIVSMDSVDRIPAILSDWFDDSARADAGQNESQE